MKDREFCVICGLNAITAEGALPRHIVSAVSCPYRQVLAETESSTLDPDDSATQKVVSTTEVDERSGNTRQAPWN